MPGEESAGAGEGEGCAVVGAAGAGTGPGLVVQKSGPEQPTTGQFTSV